MGAGLEFACRQGIPVATDFREVVRDARVDLFIFITLYVLHAGTYAAWNALEDLVTKQEQAQWELERTKLGHPTESHHVMTRVAHYEELEKRYIPGTADRITSSAGFDEKRLH